MRNSISMSNEFFTVNMSGTTRIFYMCEQSLEEGVQIELSFKACTRICFNPLMLHIKCV